MSIAFQDTSGLASEEWSQREQLLRRFDLAWRNGPRPLIEDYLPPGEGQQRGVLIELVHTELEYRLKDGESARVEEYLGRFPDLKSDPAAERELIVAELELRRRRDPGLSLDKFLERFPDHRADLQSIWSTIHHSSPAVDRPLNCPQCHEPLESLADRTGESVFCAACGAMIRLDAARSTPLLPGQSRLAKYELLDEVGRGGFGIVYRAHDIDLERIVALKVLRSGQFASQGEKERFLREARSAADLDHPSIVPVYDYGQFEGTCYLAYALVSGTTLDQRLAAGGFTFRETAALVARVAVALDHAHQKGVIHRDIKPSNILIDQNEQPHLTDFGLARREADEITLTIEGKLLGTLAYMSPEQARGEAHRIEARSDLYSLGVVLYEMLSGEIPFRGTGGMIQRQVQEDSPLPPRRLNDRIPRDLETICLKCLEKAPHQRYGSAAALEGDLRRFLNGEPILARPVGSPERLARWCRRKPLVAGLSTALGLALFVGLAGVTALWLRTRSESLRAERSDRLARETVKDFLTAVSNDPRLRRDLPGLQAFRAELLGKALDYYREFLRTRGDDPNLRGDVADAYAQVALAQGELGRKGDALESCRQALALRRELVRDRPGDVGSQRGLAETQLNLGNLQRATGRLSDAADSYDRAAAQLQSLTVAHPKVAEYQDLLAKTYQNLGVLYSDLAQQADSERSYQIALELRRELIAAQPGVAEYQISLARTHASLGLQLDTGGRSALAEQNYLEALRLLRALAAVYPSEADYRKELARAYANLGIVQDKTGRSALAERSQLAARDLLDNLAAANPDVAEYRSLLADTCNSLGLIQDNLSRREEAERNYIRAREAYRLLVVSHPEVTEFRVGLARTCGNLGVLQYEAGRNSDSEQNLLEGRNLLRPLVKSNPSEALLRSELARACLNLGELQDASGRPVEAEQSDIEARLLLEQLVHDHPDLPDYHSDLGAVMASYGKLLADRRQSREAVAALQQAIDHQRLAHSLAPKIEHYRQFLGAHYASLAAMQRSLGHPALALAATLERQSLLPDDPKEHFDVACELALCIPLVGKNRTDPSTNDRAELRRYGDLAMDALRKAVECGFRDLDAIRTDSHLNPLRSREDFRLMIMDLAFPDHPLDL